MKGVIVRVYQVLQHIYVIVGVGVIEILPHLSLKGGIHSFGLGTFYVFSGEGTDSLVFQIFLESTVQEIFSFVCRKVHRSSLQGHCLECFSNCFYRLVLSIGDSSSSSTCLRDAFLK